MSCLAYQTAASYPVCGAIAWTCLRGLPTLGTCIPQTLTPPPQSPQTCRILASHNFPWMKMVESFPMSTLTSTTRQWRMPERLGLFQTLRFTYINDPTLPLILPSDTFIHICTIQGGMLVKSSHYFTLISTCVQSVCCALLACVWDVLSSINEDISNIVGNFLFKATFLN